jgi:phage terminase large subunit GpA-like protein
MGELVFSCPKTAREIATGINTGRKSLARAQRRTMYLDCPHCGQVHSFRIGEGWIDNYGRSLPSSGEILAEPPSAA